MQDLIFVGISIASNINPSICCVAASSSELWLYRSYCCLISAVVS